MITARKRCFNDHTSMWVLLEDEKTWTYPLSKAAAVKLKLQLPVGFRLTVVFALCFLYLNLSSATDSENVYSSNLPIDLYCVCSDYLYCAFPAGSFTSFTPPPSYTTATHAPLPASEPPQYTANAASNQVISPSEKPHSSVQAERWDHITALFLAHPAHDTHKLTFPFYLPDLNIER